MKINYRFIYENVTQPEATLQQLAVTGILQVDMINEMSEEMREQLMELELLVNTLMQSTDWQMPVDGNAWMGPTGIQLQFIKC
jgi:tetrahydromethanopterin S-methyltransferase subunit B